jgi:hypothetical protein
MTYITPVVVLLGPAKRLIGLISEKTSIASESNPPPVSVGPGPAYDLDD